MPSTPPAETPAPLPTLQTAKTVRSLRRSEQAPLAPLKPPPPDSKLPIHRHSAKEINEIRRQEMIAMQGPAVPPQSLAAHLALVIPGYLLAAGAAAGIFYYEIGKSLAAACVLAAIAIAAFIFIKKPLSRHHAAFIAVIALFVIVFGALHYFPQLRHGT